jgi:two-component system, NarL family, nitrate/nitrite response regulator NarL
MANRIRVGVVDDHQIFRDGVIFALEADPNIEIVGQGGSVDDALDIVARNSPDVLLLDVNMPGGGMNAVERIAPFYPATKILMLTVVDDKERAASAMKRGAIGYILKGVTGEELLTAVHGASRGEGYISSSLAEGLLKDRAEQAATLRSLSEKFPGLSNREEQILALIVRGLTNKEIGEELDLSVMTVKGYVTTLMAKLNVSSRVEAALLACSRLPGSQADVVHAAESTPLATWHH